MSPDPTLSFAGGGEMGRVMAAHDWAATSVGPPQDWAPELRSVVRILLTSRFSMWMGWGPELAFFYNDAYSRDTLRSKHPWALGRPAREVWSEVWDDVEPRIRSVLDTGEATWDEGLLLMLERSGYTEETYHTFSYSPLRTEAGAIAGFLCVVSEDTERVLSERRLRVLSELGDISAVTAPTLGEAAVAAVAVLERGRADVPYAAVYLVEPGGTSAGRVAGHGDTETPPRIDPGQHPRMWAALEGRRAQDLDGAVVMPLAGGGGGEPVGVLLAGTSPFRALDPEYRRFLDLVAGQVGTALADAAAYQLQRRRADELAELDRAKTAFFTGVSHELRTPLTLIAGPTEDALADTVHALAPAQRARLEIVQRNSGRLRRLVDTILEFSRLEDGRAVPQRAAVDLAELTRGIAESFGPAITRAGLGFTIECPPLAAAPAVDVDMWEKIVLNLLSNAVKYTLDGAVSVELRADGVGGVALEVADTGIGIGETDLPLLFQRFHRVRGAAGRSHEGSGIGLALVSELASLHGGAVAVESTLGKGTRFTVTLPAAAATVPTAAPSGRTVSGVVRLYRDEALQWSRPGPEPVPAVPVDAGPTAGAVVLVAEDNPDLRAFLGALLDPHYTVRLADDGAAALEQARATPPDLVLTDVMMPGLDGFELLAALRTDPTTATIPVIMLSARAGEEAAIEGLEAGADDYVVKPFSSADLVARVRSNLAMARARSQEAARRSVLLNTMRDGLFVLDGAGVVVETNAAFHDIVGYRHLQFPLAAPHPWWPDPDVDPAAAAVFDDAFAALTTAGRGRFELPLDHSDGRRLWIDVVVDSMRDRDGVPVQYVGTLREVTAQRRVTEQDRLLADAGRLLAQPGGLRERLDDLVRAAAPVFGDLVAVLLAGPDGRLSEVAAAHHPERASADPDPTAVRDRLRERPPDGRAFVPPDGGGLDGVLLVPLTLAGRLLGCLVLGPAHDAADAATAEEVGRRIVLMIESHRLTTRERGLHELTLSLAVAGTVAAAARVLATGVVDATGADAVAVLIAPAGRRPEAVHVVGEPGLLVERFGHARPAELPPVVDAVRAGAPVWLPGRPRAHAALPLLVGGRVVGVLSVGYPTARAFDDDERAFLTTMATEGGLAFERAALADTRRELADTLQHSLLPPELPDHDRLALAARYLPAASDSRTGGDWYDVVTLDEDRVAIVVGDVVGQGPAAAAVMGQLRSALSAYLLQSGDPAAALTWLDRFSYRIGGARGSTAICVVLDTRSGELRWARAGHPSPLVVDAAGGAAFLDDAHGTVLGVRGAPPYTEGRTVLDVGGTVILYTDGLVERRGEIVDDGFDRLVDAAGGRARPVERLVPALLDAGLDDAGPADDVALIVARRLPAPLVGRRPAQPGELAPLRREVEAWATAAGLGAERWEDLQLALGEAVANSVEHAYAGHAAGEVRYRVTQRPDDGLSVEVGDDGTWQPPGPPGFRGRGLHVIGSLAADLVVDHDATGTRLRFTLPDEDDRGRAGPPPGPLAAPGAELIVEDDAERVRLRLVGELDLPAVAAVRPGVVERIVASTGPVVLDLRGVGYLASAGIGLVLEAVDVARDRLTLEWVPAGPVARVLRLTGLDRSVPHGPLAPGGELL